MLPALISAALMTLAFPPADLGFLAWIGLAPLFYALPNARRPRHAFALGYLFGYAHWGATVIWIGSTVSAWTHSPIGWVAWVGLVAVKSGWYGLFGLVAWWISRATSGVQRAVSFACAWTIIEWCRTQTGFAMPWSLTGYTQYRYLALIQVAEIAGVFALTWALAAMSAGLAEVWRMRREASGGRAWPAIVPGGATIALFSAYGVVTLGRSYVGPDVNLALMQTNERSFRDAMPQDLSDSESPYQITLRRHLKLSEEASKQKVDLIVWPESAVPQSPLKDAEVLHTVSEAARRTGAWHLFGSSHEDEQEKSYNSAFLFDPRGEFVERYDKTWLVPFGEWVPLRPLLPFDSVFHFPKETTPGKADAVVNAGNARMSVLICYETVFPVVSRTRVSRGANLLVSITNDSWAGESAELQQHIAMSALRAVETRRYLASSATTGITGLIHPTGAIDAMPPYSEGVMVAQARLLDGTTFYVRWGDWLVGLCAAWLVWEWVHAKTQRRKGVLEK